MAFYISLLIIHASASLLAIARAEVDLTMYQENNYEKGGAYLTMELFNACTDVLPEFNDLVNSVEINGCAMVCKDYGCKGGCIKLEPGAPELPNLSTVGFGNSISSVKDCTPELPPSTQPEKRTHATLYEHVNYKGFNDKTSSVDAHGTCVVLCANYNCGGRCERLEPMDTHPNTKPIHENLTKLKFNDAVSSVRECS